MPTVYYAAFDTDGETPLALFRIVTDDEAKSLDAERLTADGTWQDDPSVIEELREPEVALISPDDAQAVQQALLANAEPGDDELGHDDVATAAEQP